MIYRMRAILDTEEDVIRDFEIEASSSLEELHDALSQSFGFLQVMKWPLFTVLMSNGIRERKCHC